MCVLLGCLVGVIIGVPVAVYAQKWALRESWKNIAEKMGEEAADFVVGKQYRPKKGDGA